MRDASGKPEERKVLCLRLSPAREFLPPKDQVDWQMSIREFEPGYAH